MFTLRPPAPEHVTEALVKNLVKIMNKSRDHNVAVIAAYDQIVMEYKIQFPEKLGHRLLGYDERISTGISRLVQQMSVRDQFQDQSPDLLGKFLIIQARSNQKVAQLICSNEQVQYWINDLIQSNEETQNELGKHMAKLFLKYAKATTEPWAAKLMNAAAGKNAPKGPVADTGIL